MKRFLAIVALCVACAIGVGCSSSVDDGAGKSFTDQEFLNDLGSGLEARWSLNDQYYSEGKYERTSTELTALVNAELEYVRKYEKATLPDEKLMDWAHEYIPALLAEQKAAEAYEYEDPFSLQDWSAAETECTRLLSIILQNYKVPIDSKYELDVLDIIEEGSEYDKQAQVQALLDDIASDIGVSFQEEDGHLKSEVNIENTTQYTFDLVDFEVNLFDDDDELVDSYYIMIRDWVPGAIHAETMEFPLEQMPARVEVKCDSFLLASDDPVNPEPEVLDEGVAENPSETPSIPVVTRDGIVDEVSGAPLD